MSSSGKSAQRKTLLIEPEFQLRMIGFATAVIFLTAVIFIAAKALFFHQLARRLEQSSVLHGDLLFQMLAQESQVMDHILAAACGVEAFLVAGTVLWLSNRISGPLYQLRKNLLEIAEGGSPKELRFRKNDFFKSLAEAYNQHLSRIKRDD